MNLVPLLKLVTPLLTATQSIGSMFVTRDEISSKVKINLVPVVLCYMVYSTTVCAFQETETVSECTRGQLEVVKELIDAF